MCDGNSFLTGVRSISPGYPALAFKFEGNTICIEVNLNRLEDPSLVFFSYPRHMDVDDIGEALYQEIKAILTDDEEALYRKSIKISKHIQDRLDGSIGLLGIL